MRLHYLQHVPFEGLAQIAPWAQDHSFTISSTRLFAGEGLPETADFDWLVILGGPMNIYEEDLYPWLADEKGFIHRAIEEGKTVLGVCLGAQLIADVIGGKVVRNAHREIGWHPVTLTEAGNRSTVFNGLPSPCMAFHWHGDTFHLPPQAILTASSEACPNQAFEYAEGRVVGLQFHVESSLKSIHLLLEHCADELQEGEYVHSRSRILEESHRLLDIHKSMEHILGKMRSLTKS